VEPNELFQAGRLQDAIDAQTARVKASPADQTKRLFLFELLSFAGELDRARKQLDALNYDEIELQAAQTDYRRLLDSETMRRKVFQEGLPPKFLTTEQPEHLRLRLEALGRIRAGQRAEAAELLAQAAEAMPQLTGRLNDKPFDDLRDCDDLFGGILEVFAQGNYFWVPLELVELVAINPPRFPRDLLWPAARLETSAGEAGKVFLPALYPDSYSHADDQVKLGRKTDWIGDDNGPVLGHGLRMFLTGDDTSTLLEWRQLEIDAAPKETAAGPVVDEL
jgi:type VI secretion system protein ImpE